MKRPFVTTWGQLREMLTLARYLEMLRTDEPFLSLAPEFVLVHFWGVDLAKAFGTGPGTFRSLYLTHSNKDEVAQTARMIADFICIIIRTTEATMQATSTVALFANLRQTNDADGRRAVTEGRFRSSEACSWVAPTLQFICREVPEARETVLQLIPPSWHEFFGLNP